MHLPRIVSPCLLSVALVFLSSSASAGPAHSFAADDPLASSIEAARRTRDESKLQFVKTQLEQKIGQNPNDAGAYYDLARVYSYMLDVYEMRKDKKAAIGAMDKAIEAVQRSIQFNDKSADAHSLLADLYGRKISPGECDVRRPQVRAQSQRGKRQSHGPRRQESTRLGQPGPPVPPGTWTPNRIRAAP